MIAEIDIFEAMRLFSDAMRERGIVPPDAIETDGKLHRVDVEGKRGKKDAAYLFHSDGLPSGGFENWSDGIGWQNWCAKDLAQLSEEEAKAQRARVEESRRARETEDKQRKQNARTRAEQIWNEAKDCERHPYLSAKGVPAFGLKESRGSLVVPVRDIAGVIHSMQFIGEDGGKKYLAGGKKQACFALLGEPGGVLCITEGYATGASIHEACGFAVFVAFDCGNLAPVAEAVRAKYPDAKIIVCADDDHATEGNPGITKANDAAKKCKGIVATPSFTERGPKDTDWNDLHKAEGLQEVAYQLSVAVLSDAGPIDACDLFPAVLADLEARKSGKAKSTVLTGIDSVDRFTGGIRKGYLTTIGGLPGSGKTSALVTILGYNARNKIPALIFSLEMDRSDIAIRMLSMNSMVKASDIFDDRKPKDDNWKAIETAAHRMRYWELTVDDRALSMSQICEQAHRWYVSKVVNAKRETGIIAIDYLGLIRSDERTDNRNREVASLVKESKLLAKVLKAPVILLSQLSREAAKRGGEPMNSDLRDSGEIEAASDLIVFPFPAPRDEEGEIEKDSDNQYKPDLWIVGKNKNGMKGRVRVKWIPETMTYESYNRQFNGNDV